MSQTDAERLATLEAEMREMRDDMKETKDAIKGLASSFRDLATIAATGNGALTMALKIGGGIAVLWGLVIATIQMLKAE